MAAVKNYTTRYQYNEAEALQQLLRAIDSALEAENERFKSGKYEGWPDEEFTITIAGIQTAFVCGGPQIQALHEFVQSIADENFYAVDFKNSTVVD